MTHIDTLYHRVLGHAATKPAARALLLDRSEGTKSITWAGLAGLVERIRAGLHERGVGPGERVVLALPTGPELVATLVAIIAERALAVVVAMPSGRRDRAFVERILGIWADCAPRFLIEDETARSRRLAFAELADLPAVDIAELVASEAGDERPVEQVSSDQAALLQYTSGSTTRPRGIVVTAGMLEATCRQAAAVYGDNPGDTAVSWVPLYHDMGLMTAVVRPLFTGYTSVLQWPQDFIAEPIRWLRAISTHGGTLASAPDFAYMHCARRLKPDDLHGLDLSSWRVARNAGERVQPTTMDAFTALAGPAGFPPETFSPSYGMAEATLTITASTPADRPIRVRAVGPFTQGSSVRLAESGEELLSSGRPLPDTVVQVDGKPVEDVVGELEVGGPQVAKTYYRQPMRQTGDGLLATGDLGFLHQGQVFVLGRRDDVLILNGVNYFQQDIVAACRDIAGVRAGRLAGFVDRQESGQQRLVIIAESKGDGDPDEIRREVRARVLERVGAMVADVRLCAPGELPVTTSGKVQVARIRDAQQPEEQSTVKVGRV